MIPPYVVAAVSRRPGPDRMGTDVRRPVPGGYLPLGIRHAVPSQEDPDIRSRQALCGEPVTGWFMFLHLAFTGAEAADCRRCEQLVRARQAAERARTASVDNVFDVPARG